MGEFAEPLIRTHPTAPPQGEEKSPPNAKIIFLDKFLIILYGSCMLVGKSRTEPSEGAG